MEESQKIASEGTIHSLKYHRAVNMIDYIMYTVHEMEIREELKRMKDISVFDLVDEEVKMMKKLEKSKVVPSKNGTIADRKLFIMKEYYKQVLINNNDDDMDGNRKKGDGMMGKETIQVYEGGFTYKYSGLKLVAEYEKLLEFNDNRRISPFLPLWNNYFSFPPMSYLTYKPQLFEMFEKRYEKKNKKNVYVNNLIPPIPPKYQLHHKISKKH